MWWEWESRHLIVYIWRSSLPIEELDREVTLSILRLRTVCTNQYKGSIFQYILFQYLIQFIIIIIIIIIIIVIIIIIIIIIIIYNNKDANSEYRKIVDCIYVDVLTILLETFEMTPKPGSDVCQLFLCKWKSTRRNLSNI